MLCETEPMVGEGNLTDRTTAGGIRLALLLRGVRYDMVMKRMMRKWTLISTGCFLRVVALCTLCILQQGCMSTDALVVYARKDVEHTKNWNYSCDRAYRTSDGRILLCFHRVTSGTEKSDKRHTFIPIQQIERAIQSSSPGKPIEGSQFPTNWPDIFPLFWCHHQAYTGSFEKPPLEMMHRTRLEEYMNGRHADSFVWHFPIPVPVEWQEPGWPSVQSLTTNQAVPLPWRIVEGPLFSGDPDCQSPIIRQQLDGIRTRMEEAECMVVFTNAKWDGYFVYLKNRPIKNDECYLLFRVLPGGESWTTKRSWAWVFLPVTFAFDIVTFPIQVVIVFDRLNNTGRRSLLW